MQKLLSDELNAVEGRIAKGKDIPIGFDENLQCNCKFYRQYLLPCRHIFHLDTDVKVLTSNRWEAYIFMFSDCGMTVYAGIDPVWVEDVSIGGSSRVSCFILRLRQRMEQLQPNLYAIQEAMEEMSLEESTKDARL